MGKSGIVRVTLVAAGDSDVGKSCLTHAYVHRCFPAQRPPTTLDQKETLLHWNGETVHLSLWDTPGSSSYDTLRPLVYREADVVLICFALDNRASLVNVEQKWAPEIRKHLPKAPIILVGNKQVPTVKVGSGIELTGCAPIGRYIAEQSEKGRTVLGKNAQERALIQQWLEYVAVHCGNGVLSSDTAHSTLQEIDSYLADRCFFVGISLTLADVFLYYSLHPTVSSLTFKDKEKYGHLCRWFDLVQHQEGLRQNLPLVVFSKTRLYI